jgi:hypothetical protein
LAEEEVEEDEGDEGKTAAAEEVAETEANKSSILFFVMRDEFVNKTIRLE